MPGVNQEMAATIKKRRLELGMTVQDLVDASGLTRQGLAPLLRGEERQYQDRLKIAATRALGWTPDSIDRLLAGLEPEDDLNQSVPLSPALIEQQTLAIQALADSVEALTTRVAQVERELTASSQRWSAELADHQAARLEADQQLSARIDSLARAVRRA